MELKHLSAPLTIHWWVTSACNLTCPMCCTSSGVKQPRELTTEQAIRLVDDIAAMKVFTLVIGGGEPFCRGDLFKILEKCLDHNLRLHITTNGTLLNENIVNRLSSIDFPYPIQVSIDGTREKHDELRGAGMYDCAVYGMRRLREQGLSVHIASLVSRQNMEKADDVVRLGLEVGAAQVSFHGIIPVGRASKSLLNNWELSKSQWKSMEEYCQSINNDDQISLKAICDPYGDEPIGRAKQQKSSESVGGCTAGYSEVTIDAEGNVYPCILLSEPIFRAGNVASQSLYEIWFDSPTLSRVREEIHTLPTNCIECEYTKSCYGGCRGLAYSEFSSLRSRDYRCPFRSENA